MLYNKKIRVNADLVIPVNGCQFGNPVKDCPFTKYWDIKAPDDRINIFESLSEREMESIRSFHRKCIHEKVAHFQQLTKFF